MREPFNAEKEEIRIQQITELYGKINEITDNDPTMPVVIAGDFNALPNSDSINYIKSHGFFFSVFKNGFLDTPEIECTSKTLLRDVWIDYIFYGGDIIDATASYRVLNCQNKFIFWPNENEASDHTWITNKFYYKQKKVK